MPYIIHTPNNGPYVLDDQDSKFLQYFSTWGWRHEQRPNNDADVRRITDSNSKDRGNALYDIWEKEFRKRIREQPTSDGLGKSKEIGALFRVREAAKRKSWMDKFRSAFSRERGKEGNREEFGEVNYLEHMQRKWNGDDI
jgi:hypothetical protein